MKVSVPWESVRRLLKESSRAQTYMDGVESTKAEQSGSGLGVGGSRLDKHSTAFLTSEIHPSFLLPKAIFVSTIRYIHWHGRIGERHSGVDVEHMGSCKPSEDRSSEPFVVRTVEIRTFPEDSGLLEAMRRLGCNGRIYCTRPYFEGAYRIAQHDL